jgi:hypothetical protein
MKTVRAGVLLLTLSLLSLPVHMLAANAPADASNVTVADAQAFMDKAEAELLDLTNIASRANWIEETYITVDSELLAAKENEHLIARTTELVNEGKKFEKLDLPPELARKFLLMKLSLPLPAPNDPKLREELTQVAASLDASYGRGKYCPGNDQAKCKGIDPTHGQLAKSRDPKELQQLSVGSEKIGVPMKVVRGWWSCRTRAHGSWICRHRRAVALAIRHDAGSVQCLDGTAVEAGAAALSGASRLCAQAADREVRRGRRTNRLHDPSEIT